MSSTFCFTSSFFSSGRFSYFFLSASSSAALVASAARDSSASRCLIFLSTYSGDLAAVKPLDEAADVVHLVQEGLRLGEIRRHDALAEAGYLAGHRHHATRSPVWKEKASEVPF